MKAKDLILSLFDWWGKAATLRSNRPWLTFDIPSPVTSEAIRSYFDRSELENEYVARYNETSISKKKPHSYLQTELNLVYGFHKAFVTRRKTRLQIYRDDAAQKGYHNRRAVTSAYSRFTAERDAAEGE